MMDVHADLLLLEQEGLLRPADPGEQAYLFKHVLTQDTVYRTLLRQDRRALHRTIGNLYASLVHEPRDEDLLLLAHHFGKAGDNGRAAGYLKTYGEHATQISAFPEAIQAFRQALAMVGDEQAQSRSELYLELGNTYCRYPDYAAATENFNAALELATIDADAGAAATALSGLARVASQRGEHERARELGERALKAAEMANNTEAIARAHQQLGMSYNFEGNNTLAKWHLEAALVSSRQAADAEGTGSALNSLGVIAREEQELERAGAYFQEALELARARGDKYATGVRLNNLGVIAEARGDLNAAISYQEQAQALALEIGDREGAALTEINLGQLALARGEQLHARNHSQHALTELLALNSISFLLYAVAAFAKILVAQSEFGRAAELMGLALRHPSSTADIAIDFAPEIQELEQSMGTNEMEVALARGSQMDLRRTVMQLVAP